MDVLAICRACEEPDIYWATSRPPPQTTKCKKCGGEAVIARSNTGSDITQLFNEVHPGATHRKIRAMVGKLARKIERGKITIETLLRHAPRGSARRHRDDLKIGRVVYIGLGAATAGYMLSSHTSLDEQAHALALRVLQTLEEQEDWIPGPQHPVPVLEKAPKVPKRTGTQQRNRAPPRMGTSVAPKPSRRASAKAKNSKP